MCICKLQKFLIKKAPLKDTTAIERNFIFIRKSSKNIEGHKNSERSYKSVLDAEK